MTIECSCERTADIMNCWPDKTAVVQLAIDIAAIRGFFPEAVHDVLITDEKIEFWFVHIYHEEISTLAHVELSFKELIENPELYIKNRIKQENERAANDNTSSVVSPVGKTC